jgi:hypothetical protein
MYIVGKYKSCLPKLQKNVGEKKQQIFSKLFDFFFRSEWKWSLFSFTDKMHTVYVVFIM